MITKYQYTNFLVSDIHSFATPLQTALKQAGFNKKDKTHRLIILGDIFDRGQETLEVYKFIKSLPKHRRILIRGNHEDLYFELLKKDFPDAYDFSNGTVNTFCQIANINVEDLDFKKRCKSYYKKNMTPPKQYIKQSIQVLWEETIKAVANSEITYWLASDEWLNYFELDNLICVHSFIPIFNNRYLDNWRELDNNQWKDARWGCPWKLFKLGFFNPEINNNKILVCGHWHTADFHKVFEDISNDFSIYLGKNLIALDGCTAYTNKVNVLKITPAGEYLLF